MKTNNYLRAIDRRLGNPNNTFHVINEFSWEVFRTEFKMSNWIYAKEWLKYYVLKTALYLFYLNLRVRTFFGLEVDKQDL